ncbi:MAG: hypothetical protein RLN81_14145 [Balneolaceae bacterium]
MKSLLLIIIIALFTGSEAYAQNSIKSFEYKKGEVLDILLARLAPDSEELYSRYRRTAFPVAFEYTFELMPVFSITELTLGNNFPTTFVFGKWSSLEKREGFLADIVDRVPDFHEQRRNTFTYIGLTYYEIPQDITITIDTDKVNIATAFWKNENQNFSAFISDWTEEVIKYGGKVILELEEGKSPTGFYYNPDAFYLIQWESKVAFDAFAKANPLAEYETLKNVHQLRIQ